MLNIHPNFSMNSSKKLNYFFSFYFSIIIITFRCFLFFLQSLLRFPVSFTSTFIRKSISDFFHAPILIPFIDTMLSLYFRLCNLSPCTVDLDDQTTMHFWTPNHRKINKPDLVIIHGYGGNSRWQFVHQVRALSDRFNLYVPDLLFFGKSYSSRAERTDVFQGNCVAEGMRRLGVDRFTVFGISYGGFVAYQMAQMNPEAVEKVVIVNSGISWSEKQKEWHLKRVGRRISGFLVPESPQDLRFLVCLSLSNSDFIRWAPDFMLRQFIEVSLLIFRF